MKSCKTLGALVAASVFSVSAASAATIDLTDGAFGTSSPGTDVAVITETVGGVTFTFESTNNLVGTDRWLGSSGSMSNGLQVGGGGGSTLSFDLTVDKAATLTGYTTNTSGGFVLGDPLFDLTDGTSTLIDDGVINNPAGTGLFNPGGGNDVTVSGLSISLLTGTTYSFTLSATGAAVQGFFTSFEVETTPVPLPAALPMMLIGVGGLAMLRRYAR